MQISPAEATPEGAHSHRLPADHTPHSWAASASLQKDPGSTSLFTKTDDSYWYLNRA